MICFGPFVEAAEVRGTLLQRVPKIRSLPLPVEMKIESGDVQRFFKDQSCDEIEDAGCTFLSDWEAGSTIV